MPTIFPPEIEELVLDYTDYDTYGKCMKAGLFIPSEERDHRKRQQSMLRYSQAELDQIDLTDVSKKHFELVCHWNDYTFDSEITDHVIWVDFDFDFLREVDISMIADSKLQNLIQKTLQLIMKYYGENMGRQLTAIKFGIKRRCILRLGNALVRDNIRKDSGVTLSISMDKLGKEIKPVSPSFPNFLVNSISGLANHLFNFR